MSAHRVLKDILRAFDSVGPGRVPDPGDAGTINISKWGQVCSVTTAGASETRILSAATRPGILCAIVHEVDGGDFTLTVNPTSGTCYGYNQDNDTTIAFAEAADYVVFYSIKVGSEYPWRVLAQEGTNAPVEDLTVDQLTATTATIESIGATVESAEHGAGAVGTGVVPATYRYTRDGTIITEIQIDLTGLKCKGDAAKDAIGLTGAAYIGRYVVATCGVVYRVEMSCLEAPGEGTATITSDIDLGAEDVGTTEYDGAVDDVVINTGGVAAGCTYVNDAPALTANDYLYLVEGDTAATTGIYNAGQLIVRLYGHALLA